MATSDINGVLARYFGKVTVFDTNFKIIKETFGIGFCIIDNAGIGYTDSGYIVYMTMGSFIYTLGIYMLILISFQNNMPKKYFLQIYCIVLLFEFALPATTNYRFYLIFLFIFSYLNSLEDYEKEAKQIVYRK